MEINWDGQQSEDQAEFVGSHLPADECQSNAGAVVELLTASEVMSLVIEVTQSSTEIYELVADLAWTLVGSPKETQAAADPPFQRHPALLRKITIETEASVRRLRSLESKILNSQPELFDTFLDDCSAALMEFRASIADLTEMIGPEAGRTESQPQDITSAETLMRIMGRLENCSEKVESLPEKGIFVSYQLMVGTAFNLQNRAVGLVEKTLGNY